MNNFRKIDLEKRRALGAIVCLTDPCLCELIGRVGYDAAWIDMEHTYMSYKDVLCHINAASSVGIASVVRVPQNDQTATKKILEMGPDAIIFPMVHNYEEAKALIESTLYPPLGMLYAFLNQGYTLPTTRRKARKRFRIDKHIYSFSQVLQAFG